MIEPNNPEINVDELMQQVHQEASRRKANIQIISSNFNGTQASDLGLNIHQIEAFLGMAELRSAVRTKLPDKFGKLPLIGAFEKFILKALNLIFRDQREVNLNLIRSLKDAVILNRQLLEQLAELKLQTNKRLEDADARLKDADARLKDADARLKDADARVEERLGLVDNYAKGLGDRLQALEGRFDTNNTHLQEVDGRLSGVQAHLSKLDEYYSRNSSFLRSDLMQQKRLITLFLEETRQRLPEPFTQEQLETFVSVEQNTLDGFYVAFEDQFRGSQEDIFNRLRVYLPLIEKAGVGTSDSPILDVGCGRGEWLELLQQNGYAAKGIDLNGVMLEHCQARGLEVMKADVTAYLKSMPDATLGGITGFHIIEHLQFPVLMTLMQEVLRVLKPGGLAIFETPNPQNLLVGSNNFYTDPTHLKPLPSLLTKFVLEYTGFHLVEVMNLNPYEESFKLMSSEVGDLLNNYFYGPQDYAVIGHKL